MTTRIRIATFLCPVCGKSREVKGNTRDTYERLCRRCNGKATAKKRLMTHTVAVLLPGFTAYTPSTKIHQAPCLEGKAHWWIVPNGPGSEYCQNGCGQKMALERWAAMPKGPHGLLETHEKMPAWDLKPTMEVNYWG